MVPPTNYLQLLRQNPALALLTLVIVAVVRVSLWIIPFRLIEKYCVRSTPLAPPVKAADRYRKRRWAHAVKITSRLVPKASCLTQALSTLLMLQLCGEKAHLCLGVARSNIGKFEAHAWLEEDDGTVLIGGVPDLHRYQRLKPKQVSI